MKLPGEASLQMRELKRFEVQFSEALTYFITSNFLSESCYNYDSNLKMSPGQPIFWNMFTIGSLLLNLKSRNKIVPYSLLPYSDPGRHSFFFPSGKEELLQVWEYNSSHNSLHTWADVQSSRNEGNGAHISSQMQKYGCSMDSEKWEK